MNGRLTRLRRASILIAIAANLWAGLLAVPRPAVAQVVKKTGSVQTLTPEQVIQQVGIDQKLNNQVPLDLEFQDETGKTVKLRDYFGKRPVVLAPVYYTCPQMCQLILEGMTTALRGMKFSSGQEFEVIAFSIDPTEGPKESAYKKQEYAQLYGRPGAEQGWHFLTGKEDSIKRLADSVGFRYKYDPPTGEYVHASGIMVLTPQGKVARYFMGIEYPPKLLRLTLVEAAQGKIGNVVDKMLLFCYQYDMNTGRYNLAVMRLTQVLGVSTFLALGTFMLMMFRRERRQGYRLLTTDNEEERD